MGLKAMNIETGEVHRLKTMTETYCGIDIREDEASWCIVGRSAVVNCRKKQCEKPERHILNRIILKLRHCI